MRVERLGLGRFGGLADLDTGPEPLPGLVVVLGPNEAGKTTLFHLLTSLLYGFYPASRDTNPYAPWDGSETSGSMTLRLDGGASVEVERRLRSQPTGRMTKAGSVEEIRNQTLPWAEHVPRAVFLQVFALTLSELATLEEETWGRIQDRIVGSMGSGDLLPARQVVADLEQAAGELWRPNRRGNQRIRETQSAILALRDRRRTAGESDRRLRDMVSRLEGVREELQHAREERQLARVAVERVQELVPIRNQLLRIVALRVEAGSPEALAGLPSDPAEELAACRGRRQAMEARRLEIEAERAKPQADIAAFTGADREVLARRDDISALVARAAGLRGDRARISALDQELRDIHRRLETHARQLLSRPWTSDLEAPLAGISIAEIREQVRRARAAEDERRILEAAAQREMVATARGAPPASLAVSGSVLASGLLMLAFGLTWGGSLASAAGAAVSALGLALVVLWFVTERSRAAAPTADVLVAQRTGPAAAAAEAARAAVMEMLRDVPVAPGILDQPDEGLVAGLERLQDVLRDQTERARESEALRATMEAAGAEALSLAQALQLGAAVDADGAVHLLDRGLRQAEVLSQTAAAAERELDRLNREAGRLHRDEEAEASQAGDLELRLTEVGHGDLELGVRTVRDRIQARDRADQLEDELERGHPDLDEIRARIGEAEKKGDSWTLNDEDLALYKAQVEGLTERVEALATQAEALDRDIAHLQESETVEAIDGEIGSLQEEEAVLLAERDRLFVLAQVIREADRRFREEHQPDLLLRAGGHLAALTGGRYDRVIADEQVAGDRFQLAGPALATPVALAHPISTGTLEQAYLALRLAIVDHLDHGVERLPLFVDEVLVNWDDERRRRGVELLGTLSRQRQVFAFTCHPVIADELRAAGARVVDLTPITPKGAP